MVYKCEVCGFERKTDADLCQKFIKGIKTLPLMGVEKGPLEFS
jgi:hypothetical protein